MEKVIAFPLIGACGIKFGMKREIVKNFLGESKEFKKSKFSKTTTDDFSYCHVFYNNNDECEAIEIFNDVDVYIDNKKIFPTNISYLKAICTDWLEDNGYYISKSLSIGIYAPYGKMESILFGIQHYYE